MRKTAWLAALAGVCALIAPGPAAAQAWPSKPVHIVVGFAPGGPTDTVTRLAAAGMTIALGQPVIVENRPGAGGNVAAEYVAKAPPDGYTLLVGGTGPLTVNDALYSNLPFHPEKSFTFVAMTAVTPLVFAINPDVPAQSLKEFVAYAKANPGKINFGSPGVGVSTHFAAEMFQAQAGLQGQHVPYRSGALLIDGLMKGEVHWCFDAILTIQPQHKTGKLRALAVAADKRWPSWPEIPTMEEQGYKDMVVMAWFALVGPTGMPEPIVKRLNEETNKALAASDAKERLTNIGFAAAPMTPGEVAKYVAAERARWLKVAKDHNIKVE